MVYSLVLEFRVQSLGCVFHPGAAEQDMGNQDARCAQVLRVEG